MGAHACPTEREVRGRLTVGPTLLVGSAGSSWRGWLERNSNGHALVVADPESAEFGTPGRVARFEGGVPQGWRFVGSTAFLKNPVGWMSASLALTHDAPVVILPEAVDSPLCRQLLTVFAQCAMPSRILIPQGGIGANWPWPVGPEEIDATPDFPQLVKEAQRRSRWLELIEDSQIHTIRLSEVATQGCRLGSGRRVDVPTGLGEVCGNVLLWVTKHKPEDQVVSRLLDDVHASRLDLADPRSYHGTLCSFAHESGEDFGMGVVKSFDPDRGVLEVLNTAISPAPVRILKLGSLRIDSKGKEIGVHVPWAV